MRVVLFIDMLGARRRWLAGGAREATRFFNRFARLVVAAARGEPVGTVTGGGIETDAAMLVCTSTAAALRIVRQAFLWAFRTPRDLRTPRLWLRGSLVPYDGATALRHRSALSAPLESMDVHTYSAAALDAISVEKAGVKGMRLVIREELIDADARGAFRVSFDGLSFIPIRRLEHVGYPKLADGDLVDFLWMASAGADVLRETSQAMATRLRYAAADAEESAQAAATQVVFHECMAIWRSVEGKARWLRG